MKVVWATDIHLDFLSMAQVDSFCHRLLDDDPDVVLLAGDIAEAHDLEALLGRVASRLRRPVYFVLGNHDFYRSDIAFVREPIQREVRHALLIGASDGGNNYAVVLRKGALHA